MPRRIAGFTRPVEYPDSDGKPVTQGDVPFRTFHDLWDRMKTWTKAKGGMYYGGGLFVYYREGDPRVRLVPDGFIALGVPPDDRRTFKTWEEGTTPAVVFEITHPTTRRTDLGIKWRVYQDVWKVSEYFLFDPLEQYLRPSLQGYRRGRKGFVPINPRPDGSLVSRRLGLTISRADTLLRLHDTATGTKLLTHTETTLAELNAEVVKRRAELAALKKK